MRALELLRAQGSKVFLRQLLLQTLQLLHCCSCQLLQEKFPGSDRLGQQVTRSCDLPDLCVCLAPVQRAQGLG